MNLSYQLSSTGPISLKQALADPKWHQAMSIFYIFYFNYCIRLKLLRNFVKFFLEVYYLKNKIIDLSFV